MIRLFPHIKKRGVDWICVCCAVLNLVGSAGSSGACVLLSGCVRQVPNLGHGVAEWFDGHCELVAGFGGTIVSLDSPEGLCLHKSVVTRCLGCRGFAGELGWSVCWSD